jgi:hypothetical protein
MFSVSLGAAEAGAVNGDRCGAGTFPRAVRIVTAPRVSWVVRIVPASCLNAT